MGGIRSLTRYLTNRSIIDIKVSVARTKEFDPEVVLDAAMHVFWERGYEATSIQDLVDATGVQRQSLYDTFGSKHEMFLESIRRYQAMEGHQLSELTQRHPQGGLRLIRAIFESYASQTVSDDRGCFAANCSAELGISDKAVAERVRIGREGLEKLFERCLAQARNSREIGSKSDVSALAQFLVNAFFGLRLVARTRPTKTMIDNVVSVTLAALR